MLILRIALVLISIVMVTSCSSKQQVAQTDVDPIEAEDKGQLLFLTFSGQKSEGVKTFELIDAKHVEGNLKQPFSSDTVNEDDLLCVLYDENMEQISQEYIKNPFVQEFEYANEQGQLQKSRVQLDACKFTLRIQSRSDVSSIKLIDAVNRSVFFEKEL